MFKNKLFWKIFISYVVLLCGFLSLAGYFVSKVIKGYQMNLLTKHIEYDALPINHLILYILITFAITLAIGFVIIKINTSPLLNNQNCAELCAGKLCQESR